MSENEFIKKEHLSMLYALLAALGVAFYFSWSFAHGTWFDVGVYAVTVVLVGFGLIGFMLYSLDDQ
ncbi:MAG: hypothetical protein R6U17_09835 [Thermoplasmata archaeon]